MATIKAQRAVGEDSVWKDTPVAKKFNFEERINQQLLMKSNGKREKWVEEFHLKYSTATSRAKRKLQKNKGMQHTVKD